MTADNTRLASRFRLALHGHRLRTIMLTVTALLLVVGLLLVDVRIADSYQSVWLRVVNVGVLHNKHTGHLWLLQKPGQNFRMQRLGHDQDD